MSLLIKPNAVAGTPGSLRFIGAEHGDVPVSLFLVSSPPGEGPELHRHPYPEIFVVHGGQAEFQLDDARVTARAGNILIAPAGVPHRFTSSGSQELRLTAIHTAARMETEWLESATARPGGGDGMIACSPTSDPPIALIGKRGRDERTTRPSRRASWRSS